jgi:hypothetical protein
MSGWRTALCALLGLLGSAADAQDDMGQGEVIVTATRREADGYDDRVPAIGLRRQADFAVQEVAITGDTREAQKRRDEIYAMVRNAIELAQRRGGIELATGQAVVEPLTLANYRDLSLTRDQRPDAERASFLLKVKLEPGTDAKAALDRLAAFVKAVPTVGRALMEADDDLTLSVVRPDQYRDAVVGLVAQEAGRLAGRFGPGHAVEARGVDRPIEWSRASLTEVFLYVPY